MDENNKQQTNLLLYYNKRVSQSISNKYFLKKTNQVNHEKARKNINYLFLIAFFSISCSTWDSWIRQKSCTLVNQCLREMFLVSEFLFHKTKQHTSCFIYTMHLKIFLLGFYWHQIKCHISKFDISSLR